MAQRKDMVAEMQTLLGMATDEGRAFSVGEQVRFDDIKTMIGNMDALAEIAAPARPTGPIRFLDGMPALHLQQRTTRGGLVRGAIALASGERGVDTGLAHEVDCETRRRNPGRKFEGAVAISLKALISEPVQKADIGALPGGLAADSVGTTYIDSLFYRQGDAIFGPRLAQALGVNTILASEEKVHITKLTGTVSPSWIARDGDVPQSDATFDADEIEPKSIGTQITMKRSALLYGNHPSVEPLMLADLRTAMLTELDRAVLFGEGGLAPVGVASLATPGHSLASLQEALRIRNEILSYEKNEEALRWLLPDLAVAYLSSTPRFPGATVATALDGNFLAGFPYVVNPIGAAGSPTITHQQYMLGNWAYAHLVLWDSVSILANPYGAGFASGAIDVRILCDGNVYVRDPNRIVVGDATILAM